MVRSRSCCQRAVVLLRNVLIATCAYSLVLITIQLWQKGTLDPFAKKKVVEETKPTKVAVPAGLGSGTNSALRPLSVVVAKDDFLGPRPHVDTYANLTRMVEVCRGSFEGLEKMYRVGDCIKYMDTRQDDYFYIPANKPSELSSKYPSIEEAKPASKDSIGTCPGPIMQYHTYWTGPATWRVELFIKSYLWTQNLPCSRLNLWLDGDLFEDAVEVMKKDKLFQRFMPFVERGDIIIREWKFPSRIPLPEGYGSKLAEGPVATKALRKRSTTSSTTEKIEEIAIGEGIVRRPDGSEWLAITPRQMSFLPVAVSDAVRFVVLHLYGGLYCDMDVMFLRDMRPLLLPPDSNFAERWGAHSHPGDYNTAIMALQPNSSISSYLLHGGIRMGLNFHPRIIGRMAYKDGRSKEFHMLETAAFDPVWTTFNWVREGPCTIPCLHDYGEVFIGDKNIIPTFQEWEAYSGPKLKETIVPAPVRDVTHQAALRERGTEGPYDFELDRYPPNNRTMQNFLRGTFTYHIHNQWKKHPQPNSWLNIAQVAMDGFFSDGRMNPYGEKWDGPKIARFDTYPEFD